MSDARVREAWSVMTTLAMVLARFLSEFLITVLIGVKKLTELGKMGWRERVAHILSSSLAILPWIVTLYLEKGCDSVIIARDVSPMSNTSKHVGEVTVGLYGRARVEPRTIGDMEAHHIIRLKIV
jgi:hypothetical protein